MNSLNITSEAAGLFGGAVGWALHGLRRSACGAVVAALSLAAAVPAAYSAPLDRTERAAPPADPARRSMLLDVALAGQRLIAVGERGRVFLSDDQGGGWRQAKVPVSVLLTALDAPTPNTVWAVGHDGIVLKSEDAGESWDKVLTGQQINRLLVDDYRRAIAEAEADPAFPPERLETLQFNLDDAIAQQEDGVFRTLLDVRFRDENNGFVLGSYGLLLVTRDGGRNWRPLNSALGNPDGFHLNAIAFVDDSVLIAGEAGALFRSRDGGEHWQALESPYDGSFFGLQLLGDGRVMAYGLRGHAFESDDRGDSWQRVELPVGRSIAGSTRLRDGTVVLVGSFGAMLVAPPGGRFSRQALPVAAPSMAAVPVADKRIVVVGLAGAQTVTVSNVPSGGQ